MSENSSFAPKAFQIYNRDMKFKSRLLLSISLVISLLAGCGSVPGMRMEYESEEFLSMNEEPKLYAGVPVVHPHIIVDRTGFETSSDKIVIFNASFLPETFDVVNVETDKVVYSGLIKTKKNLNPGQAILGYGTFSDVVMEGTYKICCSDLGESYPFEIRDGLTGELVSDVLSVFENVSDKKVTVKKAGSDEETGDKIIQGGWVTGEEGTQEVTVASEAMMTLLTAYELFPDSFSEYTTDAGDSKILDILYHESVWLLSLQDETTGGVYKNIYSIAEDSGASYRLSDIDSASSASFAAVMAKFSYVYKDVDQDYASLCLKAADLAWKYLEKEKATEASSKDASILASAAVELYRASGLQTYYTYANALLPINPDIVGNHWDLFSSVTYMMTRKAVSVAKCSALMKDLMKQGENISQVSRDDDYLISEIDGNDSLDSLLWNMVVLSTSDYVLTNNEYATVIYNHEHYLRGRNPSSEDFLYENDEYKLKDLRSNAALIYMLAQILSGDYFVAPSDNDY